MQQAIAVTYQDLIIRSHDVYEPNLITTIVRASSPALSVAPEEDVLPPHPPEMDDYSEHSSVASIDEDELIE
jgi:hypothetical protein